MYKSCLIIPKTALQVYYPHLAKTNVIWEQVVIGYTAIVTEHSKFDEDESYSYYNDCKTMAEAKKYLRSIN